MVAIQQADERAIGNRCWHVAQLREAMQAQLANAHEIAFGERRPHHHIRHEREPTIGKPAQRRHADQRRVRSDVDIELCANPR